MFEFRQDRQEGKIVDAMEIYDGSKCALIRRRITISAIFI